jgi:hypothetical protein
MQPDNVGGYDWAIIAPEKAIIAECFEVVDWREKGVSFDVRPVEANARLMSAAPDLLSLAIRAETMLPMLADVPAAVRLMNDLRAAIAKAQPDRPTRQEE